MKAKKWCSILLSMVFAIISMPFAQARVSNVVVIPNPNTVSSNASYRVRLMVAESIPANGWVEVTFPSQFQIGENWQPHNIQLLDFSVEDNNEVKNITKLGQKIRFQITKESGTGFKEFILNVKTLPGVVDLDSPPNNQKIDSNINFSWQSVPSSERYDLIVKRSWNNEIVYQKQNIAGTQYTLTNLGTGRYQWNVRAGNDQGWGPWNEPMFFYHPCTTDPTQSEHAVEKKVKVYNTPTLTIRTEPNGPHDESDPKALENEEGEIIDGPVAIDGKCWWKVDWDNPNYPDGWSRGDFLQLVVSPPASIDKIHLSDKSDITMLFQNAVPNNLITNPNSPGSYRITLQTFDTNMGTPSSIQQSSNFDIVAHEQAPTSASVKVEPNIAGANAKMTIEFRLGSGTQNSLAAGDIIRIKFDQRLHNGVIQNIAEKAFTTVPGNIPRSCIKVNNRALAVNPQIMAGIHDTSAGQIDIIIPQNINSTSSQGAMVLIELETCANILNPIGAPWDRQISIQTLRSDGVVVVENQRISSTYNIQRRITAPLVEVSPDSTGMNAEYKLTMTVGSGSILRENSGRIDVFFPEGTHIPSSISASSIRIKVNDNNEKSPSFEPLVTGRKVSFVMPETADGGKNIIITFKVSAGIRNPITPGIYHLRISTSADPSIISSDEYTIRPMGTARVIPTPNTTAEEAKYTITFQTGYFLDGSKEDLISIIFPEAFDFDNVNEDRHHFKINGHVAKKVEKDNDNDKKIVITLPDNLVIANNSLVEVVIDKAEKIKNPTFDPDDGVSPTYYRLTIETGTTEGNITFESITSDEFMIYSPVKNVTAKPDNPSAGRVSAYEIRFDYGKIKIKNNDRITIEFPSGTSVPSYISPGNVEIKNGNHTLDIDYILVRGERIEIVVKDVTLSSETIVVRFRESCGIRNPGSPGFYRVHVSHSRESTPVASELYNIGTVGGDVQVSVEPNISIYGRGAVYNLQFVTGASGGLSIGQRIEVGFPPEYEGIFNALGNVPAGTILVNGIPTTMISKVERVVEQVDPPAGERKDPRYPTNSRVVLIETPVDILPQSQIRVEFLSTAGIDTPKVAVTPHPFHLRVLTVNEPSILLGSFHIVSTLRGQDPDNNYRPIEIELDNTDINRGTGITLTMQTGPAGSLSSGSDHIRIKFPPETYIPGFIPRDYIRIEVKVLGTDPSDYSTYPVLNPTIQDHTISFQIPHDTNIDPNHDIRIKFLSQAGIINPKIPGNYQLYVSSTREPTEVPTDSYAITGVSIARPTVSPVPSLAGAKDVQYSIRFMTGTYGRLNVGDTITFWFDSAYVGKIPSEISPQYILVNDVPCIIPPSLHDDVQLTIYTPVDIDSNSRVTVVFTKDAGIQNPVDASDDYTVGIWTLRDNSETNPLHSNKYAINDSKKITRPVVTVNPCTPFNPARYTLEFFVPVFFSDGSTDYSLPIGSKLIIRFPDNTFIPSMMDGSKILFTTENNHNIPCQVNPAINRYEITLTTPLNIKSAEYVKIDFLRESGLQNPDAGNFELTIKSDSSAKPLNAASDLNNSYAYHICPDLNFSRLEITPSPMRVPQDQAQIFVARAYDTNGRLMDYGVTYRWSLSSNIGILENNNMQTVDFYARHMGKANLSVVAQYGNRTISTSTEVVVTGALNRLQITPEAITTSRGETTRFSIHALDMNSETLDDVSFEWHMEPELGTFTYIPLSNEVDFAAKQEGKCIIRVRANYRGMIKEVEAQVIIKVGINSLAIMPSEVSHNPQPGEILGPFKVALRDSQNQPMNAFSNVQIQLSSSSPHARFSLDGIEWSTSNRMTTAIVTNFNETAPFYLSVLEPGDCTIVASSNDYNSFVLPLSVRGSRKRIVFLTSSQDLRRNIPSSRISIQLQDTLGQPYAINRDVLIGLKSSSPFGQFSSSIEPWVPIETILLNQNQHSFELYYRDSKEGSVSISVFHPLFGSSSQTMSIASPGSVSTPEVLVSPAVSGVKATYSISFNVGFDGALEEMRDEIHIFFPEGTQLPPSISPTMITINGSSLKIVPVIDIRQRFIRLIVPFSIASTEKVSLLIPDITNPEATGEYVLSVSTSAQVTKADSIPYMIEFSTMNDLICLAKPSIAATVAEYHISFSTGLKGELQEGQSIILLFDYMIHIPSTMQGSFISVNGMPLREDPQIEGKAIIINVPRAISSKTKVTILFTKDCGIINPLYPGLYEIHAYTFAEQALVKSAPFEIVQQSLIRNLKIQASPAMISQNSEYTITFETGPYGALSSEDTITLVMPDLVMPVALPSNSLAVNNILIMHGLQIQDHAIIIKVPAFIPANEKVTIVIYRQAGIINPSRPATDYRMMAYTSKEPHPVTSAPYAIESALEINYMLNPSQPDGANRWYVSEPVLIFTSNVQARIYYRINQGAEREYTEPVRLSEHGEHIVHYRGVSMLGNEAESKSFAFRYDGTAPIIETNIAEEISYTREQRLAFSVLIKDISSVTLTMNDQPIILINHSYSTIIELKQGENVFILRAMDEAGNVAMLTRRIIFKSQPPMLMITSPSSFQTLQDIYFATTPTGSELFANVRLRGSTEIGVAHIEIISDTVKDFSVNVPVDHLGNFDQTIGIRSVAGSNVLIVLARDMVGNETKVMVSYILKITIRLRIGAETGYVNGTPVQLGTKPYLKYGKHTMVPFRLIAESLGATVGWEQSTRKVSYAFRGIHVDLWIGRNTAEVTETSGQKRTVTLMAEPELISGRTWVPLRFVSEALGAKVDWDPKLWEAIVSYP